VTTSITVDPKKLKKIRTIARKHFPNVSAAIEAGIDRMIHDYALFDNMEGKKLK